MGQPLGIKFEAISFVFDIYQIDDPAERKLLFDKIQAVDMVRLKKGQYETTINSGKSAEKVKQHRQAIRGRR